MYKKLITLIIISLFLLSCQRQTIKVGFAGSVSGEGHEVGTAAKNGFQLAIDEYNAMGGIDGKMILPVIQDDQSELSEAFKIVESFKEDNISYVIGFLTSNMTPAVLEGIKSDILFISPSMSTEALTGQDDLFLRNINPLDYASRELGRVIYNRQVKDLALIYDLNNAGYTEPYSQNVKSIYEELGGEIVYEIGLKDQNLQDLASEIVTSKANGLCLILPAHKVAELLQYLDKLSYNGQIALPQWSMVTELIEKSGQAVEGAFGLTNYNSELETQALNDFKKKYQSVFDEDPSFISINAYEATVVLLEALKETDTPLDTKNYIINKTYQGLQSPYTIDEQGDGLRNFYIIEIKDGKIKPIN